MNANNKYSINYPMSLYPLQGSRAGYPKWATLYEDYFELKNNQNSTDSGKALYLSPPTVLKQFRQRMCSRKRASTIDTL